MNNTTDTDQLTPICSLCNVSHEDQRTRFPVGAKVVAKHNILLPHGSGIQVHFGTQGEVRYHCDDGRACVFFEGGTSHTFHKPEDHINRLTSDPAVRGVIPAPVEPLGEVEKWGNIVFRDLDGDLVQIDNRDTYIVIDKPVALSRSQVCSLVGHLEAWLTTGSLALGSPEAVHPAASGNSESGD